MENMHHYDENEIIFSGKKKSLMITYASKTYASQNLCTKTYAQTYASLTYASLTYASNTFIRVLILYLLLESVCNFLIM